MWPAGCRAQLCLYTAVMSHHPVHSGDSVLAVVLVVGWGPSPEGRDSDVMLCNPSPARQQVLQCDMISCDRPAQCSTCAMCHVASLITLLATTLHSTHATREAQVGSETKYCTSSYCFFPFWGQSDSRNKLYYSL